MKKFMFVVLAVCMLAVGSIKVDTVERGFQSVVISGTAGACDVVEYKVKANTAKVMKVQIYPSKKPHSVYTQYGPPDCTRRSQFVIEVQSNQVTLRGNPNPLTVYVNGKKYVLK